MHESERVYVGIDVSKAHLDVAAHGKSEVRRVVNDESGIEEIVAEFVDSTLR